MAAESFARMADPCCVFVDTHAAETIIFDGLLSTFGPDRVFRKHLDMGDVEVVGKHGRCLIERKQWSDLVSSLRPGADGASRYQVQKTHLLAERERAQADGTSLKVAYLIESGSIPSYNGVTSGMPNNQPWAALTKLSLRDGIAILWCNLPSDAARHIAYIMKALDQDGFNSTLKIAEHQTTGYAGFIKHTKKRKNVGEEAFAVMLSTVEGVSAKKAQAVKAAYPTPRALVHAFDACSSDKERDGLLADTPVGDKRLGPALAKRIRAVFT